MQVIVLNNEITHAISDWLDEKSVFKQFDVTIDNGFFGNYLVELVSPNFGVKFVRDKLQSWCQLKINNSEYFLDEICTLLGFSEKIDDSSWDNALVTSMHILSKFNNQESSEKISIVMSADSYSFGWVRQEDGYPNLNYGQPIFNSSYKPY